MSAHSSCWSFLRPLVPQGQGVAYDVDSWCPAPDIAHDVVTGNSWAALHTMRVLSAAAGAVADDSVHVKETEHTRIASALAWQKRVFENEERCLEDARGTVDIGTVLDAVNCPPPFADKQLNFQVHLRGVFKWHVVRSVETWLLAVKQELVRASPTLCEPDALVAWDERRWWLVRRISDLMVCADIEARKSSAVALHSELELVLAEHEKRVAARLDEDVNICGRARAIFEGARQLVEQAGGVLENVHATLRAEWAQEIDCDVLRSLCDRRSPVMMATSFSTPSRDALCSLHLYMERARLRGRLHDISHLDQAHSLLDCIMVDCDVLILAMADCEDQCALRCTLAVMEVEC